MKFYAVKVGREVGIFHTWAECQEQVKGYSGAIFKSFTILEDAETFLGDVSKADDKVEFKSVVREQDDADLYNMRGGLAIAYVDGSYDVAKKCYGSGAVLFYNGEKYEFSKMGNSPELVEMRNVAGEILAACEVMTYCISMNIAELEIYYDYEGIRAWALGDWKRNKSGTKNYKAFCDEVFKKLKVNFIKVKAHSNNKYNDEADALAKKAIH